MNVKPYKIDDEEFTITESISNGLCELVVEGLGEKLRVGASDASYGYGYRIYFSDGSWKGGWTDPNAAVETAAKEIISAKKRKNQKELSDDLCNYFEQLS